MMAPARPCSTRAAISHSIEGARPQKAEATVKAATPMRNMLRAADDVAEPAEGQQAEREGEDVGGDHPFDLAGVGAEVLLQAGQRDVHDGHVDQVHEAGEQQDEQRDPAARIGIGLALRARGTGSTSI